MNESSGTAPRERLESLVGDWTMRAGPPGGPPWPGTARVSFEWFAGAPLLIQRWQVDNSEAPDGAAAIGCDATSGEYYQLYTDQRDVQRIYQMSWLTAYGSSGDMVSRFPNGLPAHSLTTGTRSPVAGKSPRTVRHGEPTSS